MQIMDYNPPKHDIQLHSFDSVDKCEKLSVGLTEPKAGPILPKEEAAAPKADKKSKPKKVNITDEIIKISM